MNLTIGAELAGTDADGTELSGAGLGGADLTPLAAEGSTELWLLVVGILVAGVLLIAFWYGSRRASRHRSNLPRNPQPGADSWQSAEESTHPEHDGHEGDGPRHRRG
jgi:hypothetical protein